MTFAAKLKLLALPPHALHVGVWQMTSHSEPSPAAFHDAIDVHQSSWVVTTARHAQVTVQRGLSLQYLLQTSLAASHAERAAWPVSFKWAQSAKQQLAINLTLFLPDHCFHTFQMPCLPQWGPQDIEAESRIEAARLLRLPMESLSLDFEVHAAPDGSMLAHVMACDSHVVQAAVAMFEKLGFQLNSLTGHSDLHAYAKAWRVSPDFLSSMVHGAAVAC